ncbi:hypothetical protein H5410_061245 [Solanum commersonii]|uniref:Uncharacterized protein n=1 Tax=Solanum commersonii TaxID=4109 RepID=A0A9J5W819_SOLCO|nr:hypothetical protein H5410_061245 [Solanum commersonii]
MLGSTINPRSIYLREVHSRSSNCLEVEGFKNPFISRAHRSPIRVYSENEGYQMVGHETHRVPKLYTITMPSIGDRSTDYFCDVRHMKKLKKPCKKYMLY